jgi:hypothetical protein
MNKQIINLKFINTLNNIQNKINIDILKIKTKIINKITTINYLYNCGFIILNYDYEYITTILNSLETLINLLDTTCKHSTAKSITQNTTQSTIQSTTQSTNTKRTQILKHYETLNKVLGDVLHNIYATSGYQMLLTNIPIIGTCIGYPPDMKEKLTAIHIYDTIERISGINTINSVLQINDTTYLVKFINANDAIYTCELINKQIIETNIINAMYIMQINYLEDIDNITNDTKTNTNINTNITDYKTDYKLINYCKTFFNKSITFFNGLVKYMFSK